ncbi:MAG: periplasmic heavy metal sensor [Alphaproteobacteria bacterium]|nr:periplasmic heavy metal sensor [Alphaproteobacteria bacterium]
MNKKLLITLGVSLALNFIFIGFEASRIYYQPCGCGRGHIPPARPQIMPHHMPGGNFNPFEQKMMHKTFKDAFKNHGKEMKEAMKNVSAALKKEPFDAEQFKAALQKASEVRAAIDATVQENMVEMISKMSPEERQRFAKQFERKDKNFKHKKDMGKKGFKPHDEKLKDRPLPPPPPEEKADEE